MPDHLVHQDRRGVMVCLDPKVTEVLRVSLVCLVPQDPWDLQARRATRAIPELLVRWDPKARQAPQDPKVGEVRLVQKVIWDHPVRGAKWVLEVPRASRVSPADRPNVNSLPIGPTRP